MACKCKDFNGRVFDSVSEMCRYYGVSVSTYNNRIKNGWEQKKALMTKTNHKRETVSDGMGNIFKSISEMCRHYGIDRSVYNYRVRTGWSRQEALGIVDRDNYVTDHMGNKYKSINKMVQNYGIDINTYIQRVEAGWDKEKALTEEPNNRVYTNGVSDHLGNKFKSLYDMCQYYGISEATYIQRLKLGWSQQDALMTPIRQTGRKRAVKDHNGKEYSSITEMCRQYNIAAETYHRRIKMGWSKKEALTNTRMCQSKPQIDHLGNKYINIREMCRHYGITTNAYRHRIGHGWSKERALTTPMRGGHNNEM